MEKQSKFGKLKEHLFGRKIQGTRIFPVLVKIIIIFTLFILASNLTTNYINLVYNREEMVKLIKQLLVKDLRGLYTFSNTQYEIYSFNRDKKESIKLIETRAAQDFKEKKKAIALGISTNASFLFQATKLKKQDKFVDKKSLDKMLLDLKKGTGEGFLNIKYNGEVYISVYKYNPKWKVFILRAEEENEFYSKSRQIFWNISLISILITIACALVGMFLLKYILRFVRLITDAIMKMTAEQKLELIQLKGASNDDITFLGVAFNSLSSTINNLVTIFRKFVNKDVALKAYQEKDVRLEGTKRDLTCLFSDIKRFTFMTETLGTDIITLLNLHYDRAIHEILNHHGIIGSIIGDALLAVFGALDEYSENKSYQAIRAAYKIQEVASSLREKMSGIKKKTEKKMGRFSSLEEKVFQAVLIEVGVGIDGGEVFYGNIGSNDRMTNTVIGDNVNSASRLEGLTRIYHIPVICSEYVKIDIEENLLNHGLFFLEIDTVQVKGKTIGKKVYWPIPESAVTHKRKKDIKLYSEGLQLYYEGNWKAARTSFGKCTLQAAKIFLTRTKNQCPKDWNGIWTMQTK